MITQEEVLHVARLARLRLSAEELGRFQKELSAVLDHVRRIGEVAAAGVVPTSHVALAESPLREDLPHTPLPVEVALAPAPAREGDGFLVPSPQA